MGSNFMGTRRRLLPLAVLTIALAACQSTKDYNLERLSSAEDMLKNGGKERNAYEILNGYAYDSTDYGKRARSTINGNPAFKAKYLEFLRADIVETTSPSRLADLRRAISDARSQSLIGPELEQELVAKTDQLAAEGNRTGRLPFDYSDSDNIQAFPSLATPEAQSIIFKRSLEKITSNSSPPTALIKGVFTRTASAGPKSQEHTMAVAAMPAMKLSAQEIREYVALAFPEQAKKLLAERTTTVRLSLDPEDRLLYEDLAAKVKAISSNISLVSATEQPTVVVSVKKLQWEERREPERTQQVVYSQGDVNILAAVMLMPRNASYLYDVTSGGVEVAYAFEIKANGKSMAPYDYLLRDKVSRSWRSCSNARIQNVFGGVQPADFVANNHMQQTCNSNSSSISVDRLRDTVLDDVIRSIKRIPAIERAASIR